MLKTGIYRIEQLKQPKKLKTIFGKDKKISMTLYNELANDSQRNEIAERILLNFTDERGAYKRTYSNRFEAFDAEALKEIQKHFSQENNLTFHDVAISDGRTACDFFEKISPHFLKMDYYASDYDPYIFVVESGKTKLIFNSEGTPLEITFPPFVLNLIIQQSKYYFLNWFIHFLLEKTLIKKMVSNYKKGLLKADKRLIFSPKAIMLAKEDARFHLLQHNLLSASPLAQPVNVFRAMNILNPGYFTSDEFTIVIGHIFNALSDHGLFLMGSNQASNTLVHGGIFLKTKSGFQKIWQSGDKGPIVDMILQYRHLS